MTDDTHATDPVLWKKLPLTMTPDEFLQVEHLPGFDSAVSFEHACEVIFKEVDVLRMRTEHGQTMRQYMTGLLRRNRTQAEAQNMLKAQNMLERFGPGREAIRLPPTDALNALKVECPGWFDEFKKRIMFAYTMWVTRSAVGADWDDSTKPTPVVSHWNMPMTIRVCVEIAMARRDTTATLPSNPSIDQGAFRSFRQRYLCPGFHVTGLGHLYGAVVAQTTPRTPTVLVGDDIKLVARSDRNWQSLTKGQRERQILPGSGTEVVQVYQVCSPRNEQTLAGRIFPDGTAVFNSVATDGFVSRLFALVHDEREPKKPKPYGLIDWEEKSLNPYRPLNKVIRGVLEKAKVEGEKFKKMGYDTYYFTFYSPVPKAFYLDYNVYVPKEREICIQTIKFRAEKNKYRSLDEFMENVRRIAENARLYHTQGEKRVAHIPELGEGLVKFMQEEVDKVLKAHPELAGPFDAPRVGSNSVRNRRPDPPNTLPAKWDDFKHLLDPLDIIRNDSKLMTLMIDREEEAEGVKRFLRDRYDQDVIDTLAEFLVRHDAVNGRDALRLSDISNPYTRTALNGIVRRFLKKLMEMDYVCYFSPVRKSRLSDYNVYVPKEREMYIQNIKVKADNNEYVSLDEFMEDIRRVADNARLYHTKGQKREAHVPELADGLVTFAQEGVVKAQKEHPELANPTFGRSRQALAAFVWSKMMNERMVNLVHYLDVRKAIDCMRPHLQLFRTAYLWGTYVRFDNLTRFPAPHTATGWVEPPVRIKKRRRY